MSEKYQINLFAIRSLIKTREIVANFQNCLIENNIDFQLDIIDVMDEPQLTADYKILATPTLIKVAPPPRVKVVGDLSNAKKVLKMMKILRAG